jgi:hypothetical protein
MTPTSSQAPRETDLLAIEAFTFTPHLETAGEICVQEARAGQRVAFAYVAVDNPDDELPRRVRLRGGSTHRKARTLQRLLRQEGVATPSPRLSRSRRRDAVRFSHSRPSTLEELKALQYRGASLGLGVASSLISKVGDPQPNLAEEAARIQRYLLAAALVYDSSLSLIEAIRPKRILVFNGRFACSKPVVEAAKTTGVPYLLHERGATYERYAVFEQSVHKFAHTRQKIREAWKAAPSNAEHIAREFFRRRQAGDGVGWLSYTKDQRPGLVPERSACRRLVYFSSSDDEYAAVGDDFQDAIFVSQREAISFLIDWVATRDAHELVIRVHPHMKSKAARVRRWWDGLQGANVTLIPSGDATDSYALAQSADVVLTYCSTMGAESAFMSRPVIVLGDATYRELGCVYEPESPDAVRELLSRDELPPRSSDACLPFGYYYATYGKPYEFYSPRSLFTGSFLGTVLSPELRVLNAFRRVKAALK